jgi:hypothetical protein
VRATEWFDACFIEAGFAHPAAAIRVSEIETGVTGDQHVQAHQQAKRVLSPFEANSALRIGARLDGTSHDAL